MSEVKRFSINNLADLETGKNEPLKAVILAALSIFMASCSPEPESAQKGYFDGNYERTNLNQLGTESNGHTHGEDIELIQEKAGVALPSEADLKLHGQHKLEQELEKPEGY
jgi:hypothetical protein